MRRFWGVLWGRGSPHCGVCAHVPPADSGSAVRRAAFQAWRCGQQAGRPRQPVRGQSGLQPPQLLAGSPARPHAGRCRDRPHLTGRRRRRASWACALEVPASSRHAGLGGRSGKEVPGKSCAAAFTPACSFPELKARAGGQGGTQPRWDSPSVRSESGSSPSPWTATAALGTPPHLGSGPPACSAGCSCPEPPKACSGRGG